MDQGLQAQSLKGHVAQVTGKLLATTRSMYLSRGTLRRQESCKNFAIAFRNVERTCSLAEYSRAMVPQCCKKKPDTGSDSGKLGSTQRLSVHTLHVDSHLVGYNVVAVVFNMSCNVRGMLHQCRQTHAIILNRIRVTRQRSS